MTTAGEPEAVLAQIDYARMLDVITSSDDPEATLAAFVMRELQVLAPAVAARLAEAEQKVERVEALAEESPWCYCQDRPAVALDRLRAALTGGDG